MRDTVASLARATPALLLRRTDQAVLFDSWRGRCCDSPQALSRQLAVTAPSLPQTWVLSAGLEARLPTGARVVRPNSAEHVVALGRSRIVVSNTHLPRWFVKAPGSRYLQTWHGTPLKRVGLDVARAPRARRQVTADVAKWDVLLAQNAFAAERFTSAFHYAGPVWTEGYPHNDALLAADRELRRAAVRRQLRVPDSATVALYAPTFRDNTGGRTGRPVFRQQLDLEHLADRLGPDVVVLLRVHRYAGGSYPASPFIRDVTTHEDIAELYLAADVLITDYSSSMFDFAVTGKPMIFFAYDLEEYRDAIRGFYWPLDTEAPGPVVRDTEGVADALADLDRVRTGSAAAYAAFRQKFCPLDDGRVTERVAELLCREL